MCDNNAEMPVLQGCVCVCVFVCDAIALEQFANFLQS
jgi:hypothetical protein